jgi:AraC-like DNA-binding protein
LENPAQGDMLLWRDAALGIGGTDLLVARRTRHRYAPHIHGEFALAVFEDGAQRHRIGSLESVALPGSLVLIAPGEPHIGEPAVAGGSWSHRAFYPDAATLAAIADAHLQGPAPAAIAREGGPLIEDAPLVRRLAALHRAIERGDHEAMLRQDEFAAAMASVLLRHLGAGRGRRDAEPRRSAVTRAIDCMRSRFAEADLGVADLAAVAGLSEFHFMRSFRAATGLPAHAYLVQIRLREAASLLSKGAPSAEAATACGFFDQSHLIRHFRAAFGVTPGRYAVETRRRASAGAIRRLPFQPQ